MATVYLAVQESLQRQVALKVMKAALAADEEFAERFVREARTAASLQHPGIVAIHDTGNVGHHSYIAMEYVTGGELKARLRDGAMDVAQALGITRQMADALDYAHEKGFVHRDVKPENILFREKGSAVLTDFGVARAAGTGTRLTGTGLSIGTPHYMSPEQARGDEVDGRSDLYALGIVLHEMLTGRVPFDARDSLAIGIKHLQEAIPRLPDPLRRFEPLIDRLLAKDPADRYQTGAELIDDLDRIEQGQTIAPRRAGTRVVKGLKEQGARNKGQGSRNTGQGSGITDPGKGAGQRSGLYWGLGGAVLAAILAVGLYLWQDQQSSPPSIGGTSTVSRPAPAPALASEPETATPETGNRQPETASSGAAILSLTTTPEGAEVFLNDRRLGQTPFQSESLPAGEHRLRLVHRYYEPWEQTLRLEDDVVERIEAELQRGSGRVTIITDPPGAEIWIDGEPHDGTTPLTLSDLRSGDQQLEVRLARYRTETHSVEILPGETARLDLALEGGDLYEWDGRWLTGDEVIPFLLEAAEADLAATRLMQPEGESAWDRFQQVLDIRPGHPQATAGIQAIASRYVELAEGALNETQLDRAGTFLANARASGAEGGDYERASTRLQQAREQQQAAQRRRQLITDIQRELARLGREISPDGNLGSRTVEAIRAFERASDRSERGEATDQLLAQLRATERWPAPQPGEVFRDCPDCPEMVVIPAGRFTMGSPSNEPQRLNTEGPQRQVNISAFALATTPLTVGEFRLFVEATAYRTDAERNAGGNSGCRTREGGSWAWRSGRNWRSPGMSQDDAHPVLCLSWNDAQAYIEWLSEKTGEGYRLPSEAEWEYATRAGTSTRFNTGDCITTAQANFSGTHPAQGCPRGEFRERTTPVKTFAPNSSGLYDMHGNVWEWTQDCWNDNYTGAPSDGSAWMAGDCSRAVLRGGSWSTNGQFLRSAFRNTNARDFRDGYIGFRPARSL